MYTMIKCAVLLVAVLGYSMFYQRRRLPLCYFPITVVSGIGIVLYVAGFAGLLKIAGYVVLLPGILALACCCTKERLKALFSDVSLWFCVFAAIWMFVITRGVMLSHYDEGTHWYRISKVLCYEHAYPTTPDILFSEYVPGCALWVYFITRFIGFSIPNAMFAQNLLNVSAVTVLFCAVPKEKGFWWKVFSLLLITLIGVLLCSLTVSTYTLLVDVQVGLFALGAILFVLEHGNRKEAFISIALILGFLALMKTSAIFFIGLILIWACLWHRFKKGERIVCFCGWGVMPVLLYSAYVLRSKLAGYGSAQSVSVERYASIFGSKSLEQIIQISKKFFYAMLPGQVEGANAVYAALLLLILLFVCLKEQEEKRCILKFKQYGFGIGISLIVYILSLFITYLFSMSYDEAITLNMLYRYYGTGAIWVVGLTIYAALKISDKMRHLRTYVLSMVLIFVILAPGAFSKEYIFSIDKYRLKEDFRSDIWRTMEIYIPENKLYTDARYAVLWNEEDFFGGSRDNGRVQTIAGAWLRSADVQVVSERELRSGIDQEILESLRTYDYLVCISDMSRHSDVFSQVWGDIELMPGLRKIAHN